MQPETVLNIDWQNIVVLVCVAAAGIYLAGQAWATMARKKSGACGSCGNCASNATESERPLVQLAPPSSSQATSR